MATDTTSDDNSNKNSSVDFKSALERRRKIKRMLDSGEERFIHDILEQIADFLIGHEALKESGSSIDPDLLNLLEPSAITALSEIGKLVDPETDDITIYYPAKDGQLNAEGLLIEALINGTNNVQIAAATGLAGIGSQLKAKPVLLDRFHNDKNAFVRAKCEKALRQIDERYGVKQLGGESIKTSHLYPHQIDAMVISAGISAGIEMTPAEEGRFTGEARLEDGRLQTVEVRTCIDERMYASGREISIQYLYVTTEIMRDIEEHTDSLTTLSQLSLRLNAGVLAPENLKNDFEFSLGAIALDETRLIFGQTIPTTHISVDFLCECLLSVTKSGDELERFLQKRQSAF